MGLVHSDSIWISRFSPCGQYLATGGKDAILKIWEVIGEKSEETNESGIIMK